MVRQAIGTIAARVVVTVLNLSVVMLAGHHLGATGLGDISLIVLGITFTLLVSGLVGGGGIVYLLPRYPLRQLLVPAYGWALLTAAASMVLLPITGLVPDGTAAHIASLALIQSVLTIHLGVLLGRQRIRAYNLLSILQALVLAMVFALLLHRPDDPSVMAYIWAAYAAYSLAAIASLPAVLMGGGHTPDRPIIGPATRQLFRQGGLIQGANLLQLLNYRLAYYLLEHFQGRAALGVYSVANQLAEGAWIGPKALGTVLYGRVSNTPERMEAVRRTVQTFKAAVAMAIAILLVLVLLPDVVYGQLFGREVRDIGPVVLLLAPGIVAMSASQAFSHFFSGTGRNVHNMVGSGIGLLATLMAGHWFIPTLGAQGAALTATAAYVSNVLYQAVIFLREPQASLRDMMPRMQDLAALRDMWRRRGT